MDTTVHNMLHNHDPEPNSLDHAKKVAILAMYKCMSLVQVIVLARRLFGWELHNSREIVQNINQHYRLVDGDALLYREAGNFYLETGDRIKCLTPEFLASCPPDWGRTLQEAISSF